MTTNTTRHLIQKPADTDPVANYALISRTALDLIDKLLGETGSGTIAPSAVDTDTTLRVNYARSYAALAAVPKAFVINDANAAAGTGVQFWITGEDYTGFTLHVRATTTSLKSFRYHVRPA